MNFPEKCETSKETMEIEDKLCEKLESATLNDSDINDMLKNSGDSFSSIGNIRKEIQEGGLWTIRTFAGYIVTFKIDVDKDRPENFENKEAELMWEKAKEINLKRLKHQVQNGEFIPVDASIDVDPNPLQTPPSDREPPESETKRRKIVENWRFKKLTYLKKEMKLVNLVLAIREKFSKFHKMTAGLALMEEVLTLDVTPLMLKKNPFIVDTFRCLTHYGGMNELSVLTDANIQIKDIKNKAHEIYDKFHELFTTPTENLFEDYFKEQSVFLWRIFRFEEDRVYHLMNDPFVPNSN